MVLRALDRGDEDHIRQMLEDEIDTSLQSLRELHAESPLVDVVAQYEFLKSYRAEHPRRGATVVKIDLCSYYSYFEMMGRRVDYPPKTTGNRNHAKLAEIVAAVVAAGIRTVKIDSSCKLTAQGLAAYCDAFQSRGVDVEAVIVPIEHPGREPRHTCPT
jgi:hypothetical protein